MKFNHLTSAAAAIVLSTLAISSHATDLGVLSATPSVSVVANLAPNITFADKYYFSLATESYVSAAAVDVRIAFSDFQILGIDDFKLKLFDSADTLLSTAAPVAPFLAITDIALGAHSYYFQVSGHTFGMNGGMYAFAAQATPFIPTSGVPEPQSLALFGLGLLVVGMARVRHIKA